MPSAANDRALADGRRLLRHLAARIDFPVAFRLWDESVIPFDGTASGADTGAAGEPRHVVRIAGPDVFRALIRRPGLETLFRLYATGRIDIEGRDLIGLFRAGQSWKRGRPSPGSLIRGLPLGATLRLALGGRSDAGPAAGHVYEGEETGRDAARRDNSRFIQFHYDVSNDFYRLFLDPEMLYSCAYFHDWSEPLEQAQKNKLDMICRKLRLRPGERFLDIGCGWGALICHAATHYGVTAHGVTLSEAQFEHARAKIDRLGLADRVTVELRDYATLDGEWDKIASIGMYEHVGIANYPAYFKKLQHLLRDRGILLNHGITRRAKRKPKTFRRISQGRRIILRYIFPGSDLDHIGNTLDVMETAGFEIHDVEGWREHYALTCQHWYERLTDNADAAIDEIGAERYRMWLAYLAGVSVGFEAGPLRIFQVVASSQARKGPSELPPTRADLYA
ncbi:class I SAM-dependent methyltransferase [Oceanibacterium hippocampi]|uniref:Cyclopropane-fatty-acyl-phospholipid synthase n=1 Tax=Oceanibacterium hippocampi TaxID=745714 RepID=A0A1Y5TUF1_9PROT|nr:class I SAM-dependent methyltransferase [Oceanibacterium hippocampi]SLN73075.1 Cyclopropane-fatty-acyl-phospholipid synthase [Oceanibacterium hippocampi]